MRVAVDRVSYTAGGKALLDSVGFSAESGQTLAVIGPNGAGKSTLLHVLAGDVAPGAGSVTYDGVSVHAMTLDRRARLRAVLASAHPTDIPFTVYQVVAMGRFPYRFDAKVGQGADEAAVEDAIERLDLGLLRNRVVRSLSGGEQQRVAIARVLAQQAPLVLLDEPTTALDIGHQASVMSLVVNLKRDGHTVVAVLHDLNLAAHFDAVVILHEGSIVSSGPPSDVLTSDVLSRIYEHPIEVQEHPADAGALVLPRRLNPPSSA